MANIPSASSINTQQGLPTEKSAAKLEGEQAGAAHLNDQDLDQVAGGLSDIVITKPTDSTSPK